MTRRQRAHRGVLPGFGLTLGLSWLYVGILVLVPLLALLHKALGIGPWQLWALATDPRALASYRLSFGASLVAGAVNAVFGLLVAWVLVRYRFPGRAVVDGLVDLPFALPTAVTGLTLAALLGPHGWVGQWFARVGIPVAFTPLGVTVALTFIGLPFVVRTVQPVLRALDPELEAAAATLGANPRQTFWRVQFPQLAPSLLTGFALAVARALGEYGSIVFISGNMPMRTEITPLLIVTRLEQYDYAGASALAVVMLTASALLLLGINLLQRWSAQRTVPA
jgi:sulfate transport system permease protein